MRGFSLTEPWASAICLGLKQWETRSWVTGFRGQVCIHAAKNFPKWAKDFADQQLMAHESLPLGKIVCVCEITACRQTETVVKEISQVEYQWGDYSPGRYAFKLENVQVLADPVPAKGALGFWHVPTDVEAEVVRQIRELVL